MEVLLCPGGENSIIIGFGYLPNSIYQLTGTGNNRAVVHSIVYNVHDVIRSGRMVVGQIS